MVSMKDLRDGEAHATGDPLQGRTAPSGGERKVTEDGALEAARLNRPTDVTTEAPGGRPGASSRLVDLFRTPGFLRLWGAQVVSNVGDYAYVLAVAMTLAARFGADTLPRVTALLVAFEGGAAALVGMFAAGPIVDRFPRRRLMIVADVIRGAAVATLLMAPFPSVPQLAVVAVTLGACRAVFQPSLLSSLPNVVPPRLLVRANSIVTGTFHLAIMVGPMIGAGLVAAFGVRSTYLLNAASFGVSAVLLLGVRLPRPVPHEGAWTPVRDLVEGARHLARSPIARGITIAMGLVLFLAAWQMPFQLSFVRHVLAPEADLAARAVVIGLLTGAWGSGMVLGSLAAPWVAARLPLERILAASIAAAGLCLLIGSRSSTVWPVVAAWMAAGIGSGVANVAYETLLQERTPDRFRGRVLSAVEAVQEATFFLGALFVGAFGGRVGPATAIAAMGVGLIGIGLATVRLVPVGAAGEPVVSIPEPGWGGVTDRVRVVAR
jgi:MFS family permease